MDPVEPLIVTIKDEPSSPEEIVFQNEEYSHDPVNENNTAADASSPYFRVEPGETHKRTAEATTFSPHKLPKFESETFGAGPSRLRRARKTSTKEPAFCYVCVDDIDEGSFKDHYNRVHGDRAPCFICGITFSSLDLFLMHLNTHTLKCLKCNAIFSNRELSLKHLKTHPIETANRSDSKLKSADEANPLSPIKLVASRIGKNEFKNQCFICLKGFQTRQHLQRHEFTHREKTERCRQCNRSFESLDLLKEHRITEHTNGKKWVCKTCGLAYDKELSYRDHVNKIHLGKRKRYKCEICNKLLSNRTCYDTHMRTHSGEKPFSCKTCGNSYCDKYSMAKHEKQVHGTQVEFTCPLCRKTYHRSCLLSEHIKWTHATNLEIELSNYKCTMCHEALLDIECYIQHILNHASKKMKKVPVNGKQS
ncbi:unnamed protein product [Bemisia tabaci]|uniref:C2H2-type domain-containing protein n=1 Tax=Bemisia tabaci TaxID=7038 RepID=A0A9P0F6Y6_BEMTA|nr:unnamed protein product [Bemisia tabaci]